MSRSRQVFGFKDSVGGVRLNFSCGPKITPACSPRCIHLGASIFSFILGGLTFLGTASTAYAQISTDTTLSANPSAFQKPSSPNSSYGSRDLNERVTMRGDLGQAGADGFQSPKEEEDKDKKKEGEEEAVKGTTVNGQQLYKQTIDGKEYQYYYSTGEKGSQFISQLQPDENFKQTTMDAMLGRGVENGMRPIGSIETTNGKLATMYSIDGLPDSKAFFDGESWHIQGKGADSFTVSKGPNIPSEYGEYTGGFDAGKAPLENLPEGWSRGATSSGGEMLRGGSPVSDVGVAQGVISGGMGGPHGQLVDALNSAPYTNWGKDFDPNLMSKISGLSDAQAQNIYTQAVANANKSRTPCIGCEVGFLLERVK